MRTFHEWVLSAQWLNLRRAVAQRLHDLSLGLGESIYQRTGQQLREVYAEYDTADRIGGQALKARRSFLPSPAPDLGLPPDPRRMHTLWSGLSLREKDLLHRADPFIGNRNGIQQVDRDHYNRQTLEMLQDWADANVDIEAMGHYAEIERLLLAPSGSGRRYLSFVDDRFRAAIAVGNPDTARHVVTLPTVAGRNADGASDLVEYGDNLRAAAHAITPEGETSTIALGLQEQQLPISCRSVRCARHRRAVEKRQRGSPK
ncbi:hypothetical protein ACFYO1_02200 [Nocardia sp. NPDC006044]|uniref:hypothetical protein n=1 Tax=Nocardia sp. NPDC006044 TaxID=3364306 RepID=UPI0036A74258